MKIVVLEAIGLHLGFLGCYGCEWVATPTLDSLACEGAVFDNHFADHPLLEDEAPSSARTGVFGFRSGPKVDLLELFRERGWSADLISPPPGVRFAAQAEPAIAGWRPNDNALLWI